jgi:hypothetical protein
MPKQPHPINHVEGWLKAVKDTPATSLNAMVEEVFKHPHDDYLYTILVSDPVHDRWIVWEYNAHSQGLYCGSYKEHNVDNMHEAQQEFKRRNERHS